jgi:hypothetical protein
MPTGAAVDQFLVRRPDAAAGGVRGPGAATRFHIL